MTSCDKKTIQDLIDGTLPWPAAKSITSSYKNDDRCDTHLQILWERVPWPEQILCPIGEHLHIVQAASGRAVRCDCGHEFGDYRQNWKLNTLVRVRGDRESIEEIYPGRYACDPEWMRIREFLCLGCYTLLGSRPLHRAFRSCSTS